jgi:acetyl-CoA carboxylase biotin carboxyl carrier protein
MDIRKVKKLIELLEESGIAEIEISEGEESVRISRYSTTAQPTPAIVQDTVPPPAPVATVGASEASATTVAPVATSKQGHEITAPMVGTFYAGSAPGAKPFVQIGSKVAIGDTLCIVEAMKMMNQIESDVSGQIVSILAENGDPLEFGQVLFIIEE